jgi:hypothetical protein
LKVFAACENLGWKLSDSEIPPAKARRAPSSENYFLCGLCVFAGDIPILLVAALPRWDLRDFRGKRHRVN